MIVESSLQVGAFEEAAEWAAKSRELELRNGVVYSAWSRGILPAFFLGRWDECLEMATNFRDAWLAEERPPIAAVGSAVAAAAAIHGYRGDENASRQWFELAASMIGGGRGQRGGVWMLRADVALHHGQVEVALERVQDAGGGFWWNTAYLATRAEAFVIAGNPDAPDALAAAEATVAEQPFARAITLRARGRLEGDRTLIERSRGLFAEIGTPYQEARSAWLLGGDQRERAIEVFAELGVPNPAEEPHEAALAAG
jgi:hypothetical protein